MARWSESKENSGLKDHSNGIECWVAGPFTKVRSSTEGDPWVEWGIYVGSPGVFARR